MRDLEADLAELGVAASEPRRSPPAVALSSPPAEPPRAALELVAVSTRPLPLHAAWERWKPEFAKAMDGSFQTIESLEAMVLHGRAQLWPGKDAAIITTIQDYPGERAIQALWAAGNVSEIVAMIPGLEAYARLMGCTSVLIEGQKAWERTLKDVGFSPWSVTLRKAL